MHEDETAVSDGQDRTAAASWFAVYTKPRQEREALRQLENQGFACFLPMAFNPFQKFAPGRKKPPQGEPLFPRYLFLHAAPAVQNLATVRSTRGVHNLVRSGTRLVCVPETVIAQLRQRQDPDTGLIALDPAPLQAGEPVRVFDGPMAGAEGILAERQGEARSLLLMSILGRETTVAVDSLFLQRAG